MDTDHVSQEAMTHDAPQKKGGEVRSLILYSIISLSLAFTIRFFIAAPYLVQGASMDPTFHSADYLIVDRVTYRFEEPVRGDVIVFRFPQDPSRSFIKRVIGLPGETVTIKSEQITITNAEHPDGFQIDEPYVVPENMRETDTRITLGQDEFFVLGDNRKASADSRTWGALPRDHIIGRALLRLYPFSQVDILPGNATYIQ
ncbi:MAG: signal peptidase I [Parcubacteria group bacterium]|nr:signal peptidase I [Parcubacteria group bacterium]